MAADAERRATLARQVETLAERLAILEDLLIMAQKELWAIADTCRGVQDSI